MTTRQMARVLSAACGSVALLAGVAGAGNGADHLKCYKAKDPAPKAAYTFDLDSPYPGIPGMAGCTIKVPGKLVCGVVQKTNVSPPPPFPSATGELLGNSIYVCYKAKCPEAPPFALDVNDQFGDRQQESRKVQLLCTPATPPAP
jgi:hypothetical protein